MDQRAQASTEYLVILAVVIVVAVVVAGLIGGFLSFGKGASSSDSKLYWGSTSEVSLLEWVMKSSGKDQIVVRNDKNFDIYIKNVTIGTKTLSVNQTLTVGSRDTLSADWVVCEKGSSYSYPVSFVYDNTEFGITGITFTGDKKIVGTCQ